MPPAWLLASFQSLPLLPVSKLGPSSAYSWVDGLIYISRTQWASPVNSPVKLGVFPASSTLTDFIQLEVLRLYFPTLEPWIAWSVLLPNCFSRFIRTQMWDHPVRQPLPHRESSLSDCPSPSLLLVWMNVSSLTPWLSDFHTV